MESTEPTVKWTEIFIQHAIRLLESVRTQGENDPTNLPMGYSPDGIQLRNIATTQTLAVPGPDDPAAQNWFGTARPRSAGYRWPVPA